MSVVHECYASSECYFGLNLTPSGKPSEVVYTIMPNMAYFEFIPHGPVGKPVPGTGLVDLAHLEADTRTIPGHYVIYWELLLRNPDHGPGQAVLEKCCLAMEEELNTVYRQSRVADGSIGPLEIRVVRPGTFEELMDYAISRGASINQYKVPRCVTFPPIIELLDSRVVSAHFSPACPKWAPKGST
ncbi:uncharacterized protein A4U43_C08F13330 [Asparagus officinalis]|nr:uncharacterized protein A4U43_C08F13330 [Asparagus officinalis]